MKFTKLFVGVALMASAAFAGAANFTNSYSITLHTSDNFLTGAFKNSYAFDNTGVGNLKGFSFEDTITFTLPSNISIASSVASSIKSTQGSGIEFTSFSLYQGNKLLIDGDVGKSPSGKTALGELSYDGMSSFGDYKLVVAGKFIGTGGGSYGGTVDVTPVPEPETWGMTVSGLVAVGLMARRRKTVGGKSA